MTAQHHVTGRTYIWYIRSLLHVTGRP